MKRFKGHVWTDMRKCRNRILTCSQCQPVLASNTEHRDGSLPTSQADGSSLDPWRSCLSISRSQHLYEYKAVTVTNKMM